MSVSSIGQTSAMTVKFLVAGLLFGVPALSMSQVPEAPVLVSVDGEPVTPETAGPAFPLSWNDTAFKNVTNSSALTLSSGASRSDLSITDSGGLASILCQGSCSLSNIRINSREGVRCASGNINLNWMWVEVKGQGEDHADGLQCYNPGGTGLVTVKNTTFRAYNVAANAGFWSADGWRGSFVFENVLFWGGPFGLRIHADGYSGATAKLKNVYFVRNSFGYGAFDMDINVAQWDNVYYVDIVNGEMKNLTPVKCSVSNTTGTWSCP